MTDGPTVTRLAEASIMDLAGRNLDGFRLWRSVLLVG